MIYSGKILIWSFRYLVRGWWNIVSLHHSPNLSYSEGIGSPEAAIRFWKLCRGKSSVEGNWSVQQELLSNPPWLYTFYRGTADQNWFSFVVFEMSSGCTQQFPSAELLPLHNFQNWDCRCMRVYSFGIGEVLWILCGAERVLFGDQLVGLFWTSETVGVAWTGLVNSWQTASE